MKLYFTFKSPNALSDGLSDAMRQYKAENPNASLDDYEDHRDFLYGVLAKWMRYGEYITVEIDTDTDTATVRRP